MSKKEREICEFEIDLKFVFCLRSNLRNDNFISTLGTRGFSGTQGTSFLPKVIY